MISLDKNAVIPWADDGIVARGMLDDSKVAFRIGNEEVFRYGARGARKDVQSLARSRTMLGNVAQKVGGRETVVPFINMRISQANIQAIFINRVFGIDFAAAFAGMAAPNRFVGESKISICAGNT